MKLFTPSIEEVCCKHYFTKEVAPKGWDYLRTRNVVVYHQTHDKPPTEDGPRHEA